MAKQLSVMMITKNAEEMLERSLESVSGLADEVVIIDDYSVDKTKEIAKRFGCRYYLHHDVDLGRQRRYGIEKTTCKWVLVLDADETVSYSLYKQIKRVVNKKNNTYNGYFIQFQNHYLGRQIQFGGESYKKLWFIRKAYVTINPSLIHETFHLKRGKIGLLKGKIFHYSYRSIIQMYQKFTDYALRQAKQRSKKGEKTNLKKIFLNPAHMFWARFVEDDGYKDGFFRIPLDLGFAYMEFLTYFSMLFSKKK
jgi:glycosyltransferase involved in cell wall biosynthesis